MASPAGYSNETILHNGRKSLVFRAVREKDGEKFIIKTLRPGRSSRRGLKRLRREFEFLKIVGGPGVIKAEELYSGSDGLYLVMEDFAAVSLKDYLAERRLTSEEFCRLGEKVAAALGKLHWAGIIHKDIKPGNILLNTETMEIKLCDFGNSTRLESEQALPGTLYEDTDVLEGTLAYISPEQTGRMNRSLDYRTDLYSLGVTFYEMLAGTLPFNAKTAQELIYAHMARKPPELDSSVPTPLARIVMKLLSKNAEDRYQSCAGVAADLRTCLSQLESRGVIDELEVASLDVSDKFQVAQKLYGREQEIAVLAEAFERARSGPAELLIVAGYSGIGKTTLVNETHRPITGSGGYFISGKYDQLKRSIPYSALVDALRELILHILTRDQEEIGEWGRKLKEGLGFNAYLIADLVPELRHLIGQPERPAVMDTGDSRNRFNLVFRNFFQVMAQESHPLVLFLDDLQWADKSTLEFLQYMVSDAGLQHLLLIGAYRDNEVDESHPLYLTLKEIRGREAPLNEIKLGPLNEDHLAQLLSDTLFADDEEIRPLTSVLLTRTGGNPFHVNQWLRALYRENLFKFDYEKSRWTWDLKQIEGAGVTDSLVELLAERLRKLPERTQDLVRLAACIGNRFHVKTLAIVAQSTLEDVEEHIEDARELGFVFPAESGTEGEEGAEFRFLHDRVQQAAYALIEEERRKEVHLQVGRLLLDAFQDEDREKALFDILGHMNEGIDLMRAPAEIASIAALNQEAGLKARDATAYRPAIRYLRTALRLYNDDELWTADPGKAYELNRDLAECEYLEGNFDESEKLFFSVRRRIEDVEQIAELEHLRVVQYNNTNRQAEAIEIVRDVIRKLGVDIPPDEEIENPLAELDQINVDVDEIAAIVDAPAIQDPKVNHALILLMDIYITAYVTGRQSLAVLILIKSMILCLRHGNALVSSYVYGLYGALAGSALGDFRGGYEYGKLSVALSRKYGDTGFLAKNFLSYPALTQCWMEPWRETLPYLKEGYQHALNSGTLVYAGYLLMFWAKHPILFGMPLTEVCERGLGFIDFFRRLGDKFQLLSIKTIVYSALALEGGTRRDFLLEYEDFSEDDLAPLREPAGVLWYCWTLVCRVQLYYLRGDYEEAFAIAREGHELDIKTILFGHIQVTDFFLYASLAAAKVYEHTNDAELREKCTELVGVYREAFNYWLEQQCRPESLEFRLLLLDAEQARIHGKLNEAGEIYERAIVSAEKDGFIQHAALANQLAGEFQKTRERPGLAAFHLSEAVKGFERWEAHAVVRRLRKEFAPLLRDFESQRGLSAAFSGTATITSTSSKLDISTLLGAYQVLSRELHMDQLMEKLMRTVIEIAGAENGLLFLKQGDELEIKARAADDQIRIFESGQGSGQYSTTIVNYVAHTNTTVGTEDASRETRFAGDPYIETASPKSILCVPLQHQGIQIGILYLENNLAYGIFRSERVELVRMLSSQIAISLQNSSLYEEMENKVKERTRELEETVQELRTTQKELFASRLSAMLGRMVAGVAHEINTPIGIGVTAASTLSDQTRAALKKWEQEELSGEELRDFMQTTQEAGRLMLANLNRAADLVQAFKQVAVDQTSEGRRQFNLKDYVAELFLSLKPRLRTTRLNLELMGEDDISLDSYPGALSQVVTNLVFNSIEHAFPDNAPGNLLLKISRYEDGVRLDYSDDGTGISPEHLPHIFDLFFTTRGQTGGTGLGLHIVYNLITRKLNGRIETESESGRGTRFIIDLPKDLDAGT